MLTNVFACRRSILDDLTAYHNDGIAHGDIAPRNIVQKPGELPVIIDFSHSWTDHDCPGPDECEELRQVRRMLWENGEVGENTDRLQSEAKTDVDTNLDDINDTDDTNNTNNTDAKITMGPKIFATITLGTLFLLLFWALVAEFLPLSGNHHIRLSPFEY